MTGITQLTQNTWKVQAAVYYSLEALPDFPKELLSFFNNEENALTLTELKQVPATWRPDAARLVAERKMDADGARELARSIIDVERRREPGFSFDRTPGDALAAKIWRDAGEVPRRGAWKEAVAAIVERGLSVATSDRAKAKLRSRLEETTTAMMGPAGKGGEAAVQATLQVVRLEDEEAAFRPLPLLGMLDDVTPQMVTLAPRALSEGVFNAFRPAGNTTWVALPAWAKLQAIEAAVAVQVTDTRSLTSVPSLSAFAGPALLIINRDATEPDPKNYYMVAKASSLLIDAGGRNKIQKLDILPGLQAAAPGATVCGQVILACRPPLPPGAPKDMPAGMRDLGDAGEGEGDEAGNPFGGGADAMHVGFTDDDE